MARQTIITPDVRALLEQYPFYSQDGKRGEAVAVLRLFITGTAGVFYILEGQPYEGENGETWELYGLSNLEQGEGFRYDYFNLSELESLDLYGGLVHVERDESFTPRKLSEIAEVVASCSGIWQVEAEDGIENE